MTEPYSERGRFLRTALYFEWGLALAAIVLGWLLGVQPLRGFSFAAAHLPAQLAAIGYGVLATLPLLLGLLVIERLPWGPLIRLRELVNQQVVPLFAEASLFDLAMISLAAGCGEELLFRGLLQVWLTEMGGSWWGMNASAAMVVGLAISAALFGLAHYITHTYVVLAAGIGLYLGWLLIATGHLLAPITTHALYDFLALLYLTHRWRAGITVSEGWEERAGEEDSMGGRGSADDADVRR